MFDIGWSELLIIGVVALIVIGPKDLPEMFRTLGRFTAKAKGMARDFSRAMESAANEAGVKDVAKDLRNVTSPKAMGLDAVKSAATKFEAWDPMKAAKSTTAKPDPAAPKPDQAPAAKPEAVAKGPETQALADAQAAKRAERVAQAEPAATPAPKTAARKPAAKATAKPAAKTTAAKPAAKTAAAAKPSPKKPSSKKSDA